MLGWPRKNSRGWASLPKPSQQLQKIACCKARFNSINQPLGPLSLIPATTTSTWLASESATATPTIAAATTAEFRA